MNYDLINTRLTGYSETAAWDISVLANAAALIYDAMDHLNWCGFYLYHGGKLLLGPFKGKAACTVIEMGKGVCGTAAQRGETVLVPNVHEFPGHIACDSASNSEIVIPLYLIRRQNGTGVPAENCTEICAGTGIGVSDGLSDSSRSARKFYGVLDIDSPELNRFSEKDRVGLERLAKTIEAAVEACEHLTIEAAVELCEHLC